MAVKIKRAKNGLWHISRLKTIINREGAFWLHMHECSHDRQAVISVQPSMFATVQPVLACQVNF